MGPGVGYEGMTEFRGRGRNKPTPGPDRHPNSAIVQLAKLLSMKMEIYSEGGHVLIESNRGVQSFSKYFWKDVPGFIRWTNPRVQIESVRVSERNATK